MLTIKQLLSYRATLLIGLLISSSCASAGAEKHYHSGPPGQHFVVLLLVYETIDGPNVGDEKDDIIKANAVPAGLTDNNRRPESAEAPQKNWIPSLKASIALTCIAILLIKAFLRFQPDAAPH